MFFSVIVPIYKIEEYLEKCIQSILNQTFSDFELILVDDGSPDKCPEICDAFAEKDARVLVIHKENGGLVSARQAGMKIAQGEYIIHVDGDDWIASDMLQTAYQLICQYQVDIVSFGYSCESGLKSEKFTEIAAEGFYDKERVQKELYPSVLMNADMKHLFYTMWGKAIRREMLYPHQMAISTKTSFCEDVSGIAPAYLDAQSVYISHEVKCFYRYLQQSDSHHFKIKQYEQLIEGVRTLQAECSGKLEDFEAQLDRYVCNICFVLLLSLLEQKAPQYLTEIKKYMSCPELRQHIVRGSFRHITPKTRIVFWMFRRNWIKVSYFFLWCCKLLKAGIS